MEGTGGGELAQLVPDHVLRDEDRHELPPVVDGEGESDEVGSDRGPAGPGPPARALDRKLAEGVIPKTLPYIKRQAVEVLDTTYQTRESSQELIAKQLQDWYSKAYPDLLKQKPHLLEEAIRGVQAAYNENVFPSMEIDWETYVNHAGHGPDFDTGCYRCHDGLHENEHGQAISSDCNTCHTLLAIEEENPLILNQLRGETN